MPLHDLVAELPLEFKELPVAQKALQDGVPASDILYCLTVSMDAKPKVFWQLLNKGFSRNTAARLSAELFSVDIKEIEQLDAVPSDFDEVLETPDAYLRAYFFGRISGASHSEALDLALRTEGWSGVVYRLLRQAGSPHIEAIEVASVYGVDPQVYLDILPSSGHAVALKLAQ